MSMPVAVPTHYEVLGVDAEAGADEIKKSYRKLMMLHHPDVSSDPDAADRAANCTIAFGVLSDPARRAEYDDMLAGGGEPEPAVAFDDEWGEERDATSLVEPDATSLVEPDETEQVIEDAQVVETQSDVDAHEPGHGSHATTPAPWRPPVVHLVGPPKALVPLLVFIGVSLFVLPALASLGIGRPASWLGTHNVLFFIGVYSIVPGLAWIVGIVMAARNATDLPHRKPLSRLIAVGVVIVIAAVLLVAAPQVGIIASVAVHGVAAYLPLWEVFSVRKLSKALNRVVPAATLLNSDRFGALPGGVLADQVDLALAPMHAKLPAVRVLMCSSVESWFSHAVVLADRVVLVHGVLGPSGRYRWSGPTLLVDTGAYLPVEVDSVAGMVERIAQMRKVFGDRVSAVVCVVDPQAGEVVGTDSVGDHPAVVGADGIEDWVGRRLVTDAPDTGAVVHETVARAWSALNA